jgi:asparagine synthase (glutamine-hydrolysing)
MCGFTGYIDQNSIESSTAVLKMLELQRHRGPDDSGVVGINMRDAILEEVPSDSPYDFAISADLIFGFNRLSILDVSPAGHQPMIHEGSKVSLMMNGEIYNAFDFKSELESKGYRFKGNSDTEVVLYLYLEYGLDQMLTKLNGMFALAIYDGREKALFLVRDRMGIKPLYVLKDENHFAFSSEMKSFKALPSFKFELNEDKLSEFLLFRNAINDTLFKNVVNITPGTYLKVNTNGHCTHHVYYNLREFHNSSKPIGKSHLEMSLRNSVKRQMISDVKLGSQLSGGVDSSLVTAFASQTLEEGALETVSIVFDDKRYTEKKFIDTVVDKYGLKSHQFTLDAQAYFDLLEEAVWHFEQPINHPNTIGIKLLSREAKKHVTVLLSGEGADEALAGYSRFLPTAHKLFSIKSLKGVVKNRTRLSSYLDIIAHPDKRYILQTAYGGVSAASKLYPKFSAKKAMKSRLGLFKSINDQANRKKRKYELLSYLPDLLMRQDKMSMAHSIENRVPFLDNEMVETALHLPDDLLIKKHKEKWEGKWLLKEICSESFDESFAYRSKMGFGIPLKLFFSSEEFGEKWHKELLPRIKRRGIFNDELLEKYMKSPNQMNSEELDALWLMVVFEIWAQQYLD